MDWLQIAVIALAIAFGVIAFFDLFGRFKDGRWGDED